MPSPPAALLAVGAPRRPAAKRNGLGAVHGRPARPRRGRRGAGDDGDLLAARVRLLEGFVGRAEIADCAQLALQWLGEVARHPAIDLPHPAGGRTVAVRRRRLRPRLGRHQLQRVARRLEQPARHRVHQPQGAVLPGAAFGRRSQAPSGDAVRGRGVSRRAARRLRLLRGSVRPAAASAARRRSGPSCTGSPASSARSSIRFSASRRWPRATASRDASARCSTTSSTRSPTRFC